MIKRFDDRSALERYLPRAAEPTLSDWQQRGAELWRRVEHAVAEHPKQSLLAALTLGAVVGWLTKRR